MEILTHVNQSGNNHEYIAQTQAKLDEYTAGVQKLRSEIAPMKLGIQIPFPRIELPPTANGLSGQQALQAIDAQVEKRDFIEFSDLLRRRVIKEEVGRGVRMQYLNLLAESISPEPHYLKSTESCSRKFQHA